MAQGYAGSFVEHYLLPLIYPDAMTRELALLLGAGLVLVNGLLYALWLSRQRRRSCFVERISADGRGRWVAGR